MLTVKFRISAEQCADAAMALCCYPSQNKEKTAVLAGKTPFYLKASDRKRIELEAKFEELQAKGGLDKFMEKRRKKNASKDHRYVPGRRDE